MKKQKDETISKFNKRFMKMYNKLWDDIKSPQTEAKASYASSFDPNFALMFRERRSTTLADIHNDTTNLETNMATFGKLK